MTIHAGIDAGTQSLKVVLYDAAGRHPLPRAAKGELAVHIVRHLATLLAAGGRRA